MCEAYTITYYKRINTRVNVWLVLLLYVCVVHTHELNLCRMWLVCILFLWIWLQLIKVVHLAFFRTFIKFNIDGWQYVLPLLIFTKICETHEADKEMFDYAGCFRAKNKLANTMLFPTNIYGNLIMPNIIILIYSSHLWFVINM